MEELRPKSDYFSIETPEQGVTVIDFKDQKENIWTEEKLDAFLEIVEELEQNPPEHGVIFLMGNHYGADVFFFDGATQEQFVEYIQKINLAFNKVEALKCQTIAVFKSCFGGGLELALACKKRIGIEGPKVKIGQTEVKFGLIPGAGGTQRLPSIIGAEAIPMIVNGETINTETALKIGLIDRKISETDDPVEEARKLMNKDPKEKVTIKMEDAINTANRRTDIEHLKYNQVAALHAIMAGIKHPELQAQDRLFIEQYWFWVLDPDELHESVAQFKATRRRVADVMNLI